MSKRKAVFPNNVRYQSPYQLEDCQRRLGYLRCDRQPIHFIPIDDNRIQFRIRYIEHKQTSYPIIAFEITGTLHRWGGTNTVIEAYQLKRMTARIDTWVVLFIVFSSLIALGLMLPALLNLSERLQTWLLIVLLALGIGLLPVITWARQTLALHIEHDINALHQSILRVLSIDND